MNRNTLKFVVPLSFLILILCGVLILNVVFTRELDQNEHFENVPTSKVFDAYLKKFNKSYTEAEYKIRLKYFRVSFLFLFFLLFQYKYIFYMFLYFVLNR